jgi:hypothetical protein
MPPIGTPIKPFTLNIDAMICNIGAMTNSKIMIILYYILSL